MPGCRGDGDCESAVAGSYCDADSGQCRCRVELVAGRRLNASCARIAGPPTCRRHVDCSDAIPDSHCDSAGRCRCDVLTADDGTGTACVRRPIGGFCRRSADCQLPDSVCGAAARCECVSGFYAVDGATSTPTCVRRRVGSACGATSDCADAFTGSDCVDGACACRREYTAVDDDGGSCRRRRIDSNDDAACGRPDDCEAMFGDRSWCGAAGRCVCLSGYRPDDERSSCVRRRLLNDTWPCRDHADCADAIPDSRCDPRTLLCACPNGYRQTASGGNGSSEICRRRTVGDLCATDADCSAILSATCSASGVCACATGYGIPSGGGVDCLRRRIGGDVPCEEDGDCLESVVFSVCSRHQATCACLPGYMDIDNATSCVRRKRCTVKPAFHDAVTDTDIVATILARMSARMSVSVSVSASWNASLRELMSVCVCACCFQWSLYAVSLERRPNKPSHRDQQTTGARRRGAAFTSQN